MKLNKSLPLLALILALAVSAAAQSTIFNLPSTDVMQDAQTYVEADFISHLDTYQNGGFQSYGVRAVRGIGKNVEVGANVFYTRDGADNPAEFHPNIKWQAYSNESKGVAVSTGAVMWVPLNSAAGDKVTGMVYSTASKETDKLKGLRVTGGAYTMVGPSEVVGTRAGVIAAVEKPVTKRVSLVADWASGKNRVGYTGAGIVFATKKNQSLFLGYNFGNSGRGNNGFAAFYGISF